MKKLSFALFPFLFLILGCAANYKFTPAQGMNDVRLSSRSVPTKSSTESERTLQEKGFIHIGYLGLTDEIKSCWDKDCQNFQCPDSIPPKDLTKEFLEKAASEGGDVAVFTSTAKKGISSISKPSGPCLRTQDKYIEVLYCCQYGKGYCVSTCSRPQKTTVCIEHALVHGKQCSFVTAANIWRYDRNAEAFKRPII